MTVSNTLRNLSLDIQGDKGVKPGGNPLNQTLIVHNRGDSTADIEVWIEPADMRADPLLRWFSFSQNKLRILKRSDEELTLSFNAPLQAEPGFYKYDICVKSPQYSDEGTLRRPQQLQVLEPDQDLAIKLAEPKILLSPATDSTAPHVLQSGGEFKLTITVENLSEQTDRFFAKCPDLPEHWYTVEYPESEGNIPGLINRTNGLQLNPKKNGEISLRIHPPIYALAGNYSPTVRVTSSNQESLMLLEIVYLTIPIDDRLILKLDPSSRKLPSKNNFFEILVENVGNVRRELLLSVEDDESKLQYRLAPDILYLEPSEKIISLLTFHPRHRWLQLWRMREQVIEFKIGIQNFETASTAIDLEEDSDSLSSIPLALPASLPVGKIVWKAQRRWLLRLLVISLGLGLLISGTLLIWYFFFWLPSLRPQIAEFSSVRKEYEAENADNNTASVSLNWEITNPKEISTIKLNLTNESDDSDWDYVFEDVDKLKDSGYCQSIQAESGNGIVARLLGLHRQLARRDESILKIDCNNVPISQLGSLQGVAKKSDLRQSTISSEAEESQLTEGTYKLELEVTDLNRNLDREKIEVAINPAKSPQILLLSATAPEYKMLEEGNNLENAIAFSEKISVSSGGTKSCTDESEYDPVEETQTSSTVLERRSLPVPVIDDPSTQNASPTGNLPLAPIALNWEISNCQDIERLRLIGADPDGTQKVPEEFYDFSDGIPAELAPYCDAMENKLFCKDVPTNALQAGQYIFHLLVVPKNQTDVEPSLKLTPTISIRAPLPAISAFFVDGESVEMRPKRVLAINPARQSINLHLAWNVEKAAAVELLPVPGVVRNHNGSIIYTVSATPGMETITLQAINDSGDKVSQTVFLEKVASDMSQNPAGNIQGESGVPDSLPPIPFPPIGVDRSRSPSSLPPAEQPPRAR